MFMNRTDRHIALTNSHTLKLTKVTKDKSLFVYGISDRKVGGIDLLKPDGNVAPVFPSALTKSVPPPFSKEPTGLAGKGRETEQAVTPETSRKS